MAYIQHNQNRIRDIIRKSKIYAERHYAYPFPEEPFFRDILEKCIIDAHGNCCISTLHELRIKKFWDFTKSQALSYVVNAINEIEGPLAIPGQARYYADKLGTSSENAIKKLLELKKQFEDRNDYVVR